MKNSLVLILIIFRVSCCLAQEQDTIKLYNGQVLIGEIKAAKLGEITIDDKDLKYVNIRMYKIKYLVAIHTQFRLQTNNKKIYYTTMKPAEEPGKIIIDDGIYPLTLFITDISILMPIEKGFISKLNGNFGLGFSFTKSSNIGQVNMNSAVYYTTKKVDYQLTVSAIASIDSGNLSRDNETVQLFGSYNLTTSWFLAGQFNYQRNLELSLARRFQELVGAGNKIVLQRDWELWALSGLSLGQEKSTLGENSLTLEMPFSLRFNFFKYEKINLQLSANQTFFVSLTEAGRVRYDGNISYSHELVHNFFLSINFYTNFDSRPPDEGASKFDYGTSLNVSFKF